MKARHNRLAFLYLKKRPRPGEGSAESLGGHFYRAFATLGNSYGQPHSMSEFTTRVIFRPPPYGYKWEVLKGTKVLRAGNASSHEEADAAANRAIAEIEAEAASDAIDRTTPPRRGKP
jgi:hypothetical protein